MFNVKHCGFQLTFTDKIITSRSNVDKLYKGLGSEPYTVSVTYSSLY